jgi:hypothetical protein
VAVNLKLNKDSHWQQSFEARYREGVGNLAITLFKQRKNKLPRFLGMINYFDKFVIPYLKNLLPFELC